MPKRYTESEKWRDAWFANLSNRDKLTWLYLLDACDWAGVFEIVPQNDAAALGERIDWDAFILQSEGRVERLSADKLWLVRFIGFQFPKGLKSGCKAHGPAIRSIAKNGLSDRVSIDGPKGSQRVPDKDKDKDKGKDLRELEDFPPDAREAVRDWLAYKAESGDGYTGTAWKCFAGRVRNLCEKHGAGLVCEAMQRAISNGWKGWDHGLDKLAAKCADGPRSKSQDATQRFLQAEHGDTRSSSEGGQLAIRGPRPDGA